VRKGIIPEIYTAFIYRDNLWAMPFLANFQLFYTNMALLHRAGFHDPPSSLEEVVNMASAAKTKGVVKYPLFDSLRKQEALVCEYVWFTGAFGGETFDENGKPIFNEGAVVRLKFRLKKTMVMSLMFVRMLPAITVVIPFFIIVNVIDSGLISPFGRYVHLYDSKQLLIILYTSFTLG